MEDKKWWQSSADPAKISLTLKAFIPFILFFGGTFGLNITQGDVDTAVMGISGIVSGVLVLYGLIRKFKR